MLVTMDDIRISFQIRSVFLIFFELNLINGRQLWRTFGYPFGYMLATMDL